MSRTVVLETPRLILRRLTLDDAQFMVTLLNDPSFFANIGDKGIRTIEQARQFLLDSHLASYESNGYGHYLVEVKESGESIGTCGLIDRKALGEIERCVQKRRGRTGRGADRLAKGACEHAEEAIAG